MFKKIVSMSDINEGKSLNGGGPEACLTGSCPTVFEADDGNYIFQGFVLSAEQKAMLNMAPNEDAVIIPKMLLDAIRR